MAFDLGWNFRGTSGFVTDQAFAVPGLGESYPHTYTAANGYSINAGYDTTGPSKINRSATNDPRLAGINFYPGGSHGNFHIDLSSGSAPGAGSYSIDLAVGDQGGTQTEFFTVLDNVTTLITTSSTITGAGHYLDATLTDVAATTTWPGTPVTKTFGSTTCNVNLGDPLDGGSNSTLAHFRLTLQATGAAARQLVSSLMLLGVGA